MTTVADDLIDEAITKEGGYCNVPSAIFAALTSRLMAKSYEVANNHPVTGNVREYQCSVPGCTRNGYAKGLCGGHYIRMLKGKELDSPLKNRKSGTHCSDCGKKLNGKGGWGLCSNHYKKTRSRIIKATLVELLGGECQHCHKTFHHSAYDFHHLHAKDDSPSFLINNGAVKDIAEELAKCILLCACCHRIVHFEE